MELTEGQGEAGEKAGDGRMWLPTVIRPFPSLTWHKYGTSERDPQGGGEGVGPPWRKLLDNWMARQNF